MGLHLGKREIRNSPCLEGALSKRVPVAKKREQTEGAITLDASLQNFAPGESIGASDLKSRRVRGDRKKFEKSPTSSRGGGGLSQGVLTRIVSS